MKYDHPAYKKGYRILARLAVLGVRPFKEYVAYVPVEKEKN